MIALLSALMNVLSAWAALWVIIIGLGILVRRCFGLRVQAIDSLLSSFWMGWVFTLVVLQIWHLQFSVDWRILVLLSALSGAGLLWSRQDVRMLMTNRFPGWLLFGIAFVVSAVWRADQAIRPPANSDSGNSQGPTSSFLAFGAAAFLSALGLYATSITSQGDT